MDGDPEITDSARPPGRGLARVALMVAGAIAAVVVGNVALLGFASQRNDPVGRLSPVTTVTAPAEPAVTTAAPATAPPATTTSPGTRTATVPAAPAARAPAQRVTTTDDDGDDGSRRRRRRGRDGESDDD